MYVSKMEAIGKRLRKLREQLSEIETSTISFPKSVEAFSMNYPKSKKVLQIMSQQVSELICQKFYRKWQHKVQQRACNRSKNKILPSSSSDSDSDSFDENAIFEVQEKLRFQLDRLNKIVTSQRVLASPPKRVAPASTSQESEHISANTISVEIPATQKSILRAPTSDIRKPTGKHITFIKPAEEPLPSAADLIAKASLLRREEDDDDRIVGEILVISSEEGENPAEEDSDSDIMPLPMPIEDVDVKDVDDEQIDSISSADSENCEPESPIPKKSAKAVDDSINLSDVSDDDYDFN